MRIEERKTDIEAIEEDKEYIGNLRDTSITSMKNNHQHIYEVDDMGSGQTVAMIPHNYTDAHRHTIEEWVVQSTNDHTHTIYDASSGPYTLER